MPMVATDHLTNDIQLPVLLCGGGDPVSREHGGARGRHCAAGDVCLSMFHVAEDQEAKEIWCGVVGELGVGSYGDGAEFGHDCSWCICGH